jgi:serine/threonine protein kinase
VDVPIVADEPLDAFKRPDPIQVQRNTLAPGVFTPSGMSRKLSSASLGFAKLKRPKTMGHIDVDMSKPLRKMQDHFTIGQEIGEGAYAVVHEVVRINQNDNGSKGTGLEKYAAKVYEKEGYDEVGKTLVDALKREVEILAEISHPNVVTLEGLYEDDDNYFVVSEMLAGGDLFNLLCDHGQFSEDELRVVTRTLLGALKYCHLKNIVHSDIKLDK